FSRDWSSDVCSSDLQVLTVIALDLEGTLISNAMSQLPCPGLYGFLEGCRSICNRVVMFTTVNEVTFREIAALLVAEGTAPSWFKIGRASCRDRVYMA